MVRVRVLSCALVLFVGLANAWAQNVKSAGEWSVEYPTNSGAFNFSGYLSYHYFGLVNNPSPPPPQFNRYSTAQAKAKGTVTQNSYFWTPDQSKYDGETLLKQTFTLNTESVVQVPYYWNGNITFFGSGNDSRGFAAFGINIYRTSDNTNVFSYSQSLTRTAAQGDAGVNTAQLHYVTLPAGEYRVETHQVIQALTAWNNTGSSGSGVTVDFGSSTDTAHDFKGGATNIGAWATNLPGSRANIKAPTARSTYNVTGNGVTVGLIEVGRPYNAADWSGEHPALAGKLSLVGHANLGLTRHRSEHAQAVASIIAGKDPGNDNEKSGVAPDANIRTAALGTNTFQECLDNLINAGTRIINMSATTHSATPGLDPNNDFRKVNIAVNANPDLLFVKSSGNTSSGHAQGPVTAPGLSYNLLSVGGLDRNHQRRADYSSFGGTGGNYYPKPDLVAPSDQILVAAPFGTGYTRAFTGERFEINGVNPESGTVRGTSFAAPHVAGVAALMHEMAAVKGFDKDHRVIKAVLMNSADRSVKHYNGDPWSQTTGGSFTAADPYIVYSNTDLQLGAGKVDALAALKLYNEGEIRGADNYEPGLKIPVNGMNKSFWDLQTVNGNSRVDYLLEGVPQSIKAVLNWSARDDDGLSNLEMRLYREGDDPFNPRGWDVGDLMLATTKSVNPGFAQQNVGLFDLSAIPVDFPTDPVFGGPDDVVVIPKLFDLNQRFYLSIVNLSPEDTVYGLAMDYVGVPVPEPVLAGLVLIGLLLARRRAGAIG